MTLIKWQFQNRWHILESHAKHALFVHCNGVVFGLYQTKDVEELPKGVCKKCREAWARKQPDFERGGVRE
jgi:hypothetical protein